jgi:anaerobic magnesium-protoporphyrin IX monomethyl ester cyclase
MRIMLIYPLPRLVYKYKPRWLPLGLAFIASSLRTAGHEVIIFDRYASAASQFVHKDEVKGMADRFMLEQIAQFEPDLIGFNTVSPLIFDTVECAALIRQSFDGLLIAGGHHVTALPELTLQKIPELDVVIQGEGELALTRLAGGEDPSSMPGVWWRNSDRQILGSSPKQINSLDSLPMPALDLMDMSFYTRPSRTAVRNHHLSVVPVITSRGCYNCCDFCSESMTYGKGVRFHSPAYVLDWVKKIISDYNPQGLYFHDNDFLADRDRAEEICAQLIAAGISTKLKFAVQTRVNHLDPHIIESLKRAGCALIELGIESTSQAQLDAVHKNASVDMNLQALEMCRKAGLSAHAYLLTDFADEQLTDLKKRKQWLDRAGKHFTYDINELKLHPGTKLYVESKVNFFEEGEWSEKEVTNFYDISHLSGLTQKEKKRINRSTNFDRRIRKSLAIMRHNRPGVILKIALEKIKKVVLKILGAG